MSVDVQGIQLATTARPVPVTAASGAAALGVDHGLGDSIPPARTVATALGQVSRAVK